MFYSVDTRNGKTLCRPNEELVRSENITSVNPKRFGNLGRARISTLSKDAYNKTPNHLAVTFDGGEIVYGSVDGFFAKGLEIIHMGIAVAPEHLGKCVAINLLHTLTSAEFRSFVLLNDILPDRHQNPVVVGLTDTWQLDDSLVPTLIFDRPEALNFSRYRVELKLLPVIRV